MKLGIKTHLPLVSRGYDSGRTFANCRGDLGKDRLAALVSLVAIKVIQRKHTVTYGAIVVYTTYVVNVSGYALKLDH